MPILIVYLQQIAVRMKDLHEDREEIEHCAG